MWRTQWVGTNNKRSLLRLLLKAMKILRQYTVYLYYSAPENLPKLFGVMCAIFWGSPEGFPPLAEELLTSPKTLLMPCGILICPVASLQALVNP